MMKSKSITCVPLSCALMCVCGSALAQTQVVKPPIAQYWMDVATLSMMGMDEMPDMGAVGGLLGNLTGMQALGGSSFGATRGMMPGRWLDLAVVTQRKPAGTEATQAIPAGQNMGASLLLLPYVPAPQKTESGGGPRSQPETMDETPRQPKGRILFYWGCSETVRPGQPRVLDFAKSAPEDWGKFMMGRSVRDNGAKAAPGHALWPNEKQRQRVPKDASLIGTHALSGEGLPESLRFTLGEAQDFLPKMAVSNQGSGASATMLTWPALGNARAYFHSAMSGSSSKEGEDSSSEMVIWSSSDLPEPGWGLLDFASNTNIDQWLKEKVLLPATQTQCAIPAGIFAKAKGGMLRSIAYGNELNLAHPPRPTDVRTPWEPEWAARIRVKSVSMSMLGDENQPRAQRPSRSSPDGNPRGQGNPQESGADNKPATNREDKPLIPGLPGMPSVGNVLKGLFGN